MFDRVRRSLAAQRLASLPRRCKAIFEALEPRRLLAHFAVVGDFSVDNQTAPTRDVANLVKGWNPDFIATVGDNNYPDGAAATIDANVGQWYHAYISPYSGSYGGGASGGNKFFPAIGNHDWSVNSGGYTPYLNYFSLPGNERYYTTVQGNVQLFVVNSDSHEPDGTSSSSIQGQWLQNALATSTAQWKLVLFHHPAYSSGTTGSNTYMQWPFQQWGASAVISGHDHVYERIIKNGFPYFVNGLGGESIFGFNTPISGSASRYESDYGAMLIDTSSSSMNFQFINRSGQVIDSYSLGGTVTKPNAPTGLSVSAQASTQAKLTWTDGSLGSTASFNIQRSTDGVNFSTIGSTLAGTTTYLDQGLAPGGSYTYRVTATNSAGTSSPSNTASVTLPTGSTTFLSDLAWVSGTAGWGPPERDMSIGGSSAGDGRQITLNGVGYTKGLGTHAVSDIVINLNKQYSQFMSDVGVDDETGPGTVQFQVFFDNSSTPAYDSGVMTQAGATKSFTLDVSNVTQLRLHVGNGGDNTDYDHADWANARLQSVSASQPPAAPTGLVATAVSPTQINISWNDVLNESGFRVERSTDNITFAPIGTTLASVTSFADKTVSGDTRYYYRVIASNASGDSPPSNVDFARPMQIPSDPTNLVATASSGNQIDLTWDNPNTDDELNWKIERSPDGVNNWTLIATIPEVETYSDTTVSPGTTYFYRLYGNNLAGNSGYSNVASATTPVSSNPTYIATGSTWKYLDNGSNQGTAWRATSFNDSTWKSGKAQLGYGDGDEATVVSFGSNANSKFITTYFRQSFNVANAAQVSALTLRLLRDDGAVVYLNGTEVYRNNMPTGTIAYTTRASTSVEDNTFFSSSVSPALLVNGTNVIAVEIHQNDATSSDISFDFELKGTLSGAVTIPSDPANLVAAAVSQSQINLTWQDNSSNETGFKVERSLDGSTGWTLITTTAANATSYSDTGLTAGTKYYYRVRATNSAGDSNNTLVANATTSSNTAVTYIATGSQWKYLDNGSNQGSAWRATSFVDSSWKTGNAQLGYGDGDEATVVSFGSNASNKFITTYFRKAFTVGDASKVTALVLRILRDDGAVVYLNGTEVFRTNMPTGTISSTTLASSGIEDNNFYSQSISPALLVTGTNVIAVEIHQSDKTSTDISFDFDLKATLTQAAPAGSLSALRDPVVPMPTVLLGVSDPPTMDNDLLDLLA